MQNVSRASGEDVQKSNSGESSTRSTARAAISTPKDFKQEQSRPAAAQYSMADLTDLTDEEEDFVIVSCTLDADKLDDDIRDLHNVSPNTQVDLKAISKTADLVQLRIETDGHLGKDKKASPAEVDNDDFADKVKELLEEKRIVNDPTHNGVGLLSLACLAGQYELVKGLLERQANVEDRGSNGACTPLMEAARAGDLDIAKLLIQNGADVNAQSSSGKTPLMYACAGDHSDLVNFLLNVGANVEDHNKDGNTLFIECAGAGHVCVAKMLLNHPHVRHVKMAELLKRRADKKTKTKELFALLMEACANGRLEVARVLLDFGANVNVTPGSYESPLLLATSGGHMELLFLLLERGANIEQVNSKGYTPLMIAAAKGQVDMAALLLTQGAMLNAQVYKTKETALSLACRGGHFNVVDFFVKAGADMELGAKTALMEAVLNRRLDLVKYLLRQNANVHACTATRDTALTYACGMGSAEIADLLLQAGADVEHKSEGGITPLMKAIQGGDVSIVQVLIKHGANVDQQTAKNDHTPLSLACANGNLAIVELLLSNYADPTPRLKDNSTMLIEASRGGHDVIAKCLLDYPRKLMSTLSSHMARQPHFLLTNTVATQYIDPNLPMDSLTGTQDPTEHGVNPLIDVNAQTDSNHDTALTLACAGGHEELAKLLLTHGANVGIKFDHRNKDGYTPLLLAATTGLAKVVKILLNLGADIEEVYKPTMDTPLTLACTKGHHKVVEILLNRGARIP